MKRWITTFVLILLVTILLSQTVLAADRTVIDSGKCGSNVTWALYTDGDLVISGTGPMYDYFWSMYTDSTQSPWKSRRSSIKTITIEKGVTSIGEDAFRMCSSLTSVEIPNSVTSIGDYAFHGCSLTSIEIPAGVTSIGNYAFEHCRSLTSVVIPDGVTRIGNSAFYNCSSLTSIEIPDSVTSIGNSAFSGCSSLTSVEIPEGVTSIGEYTFSGCSSLTSVVIPEGVTSIGNSAFYNCSSLTSVVIPEGVTSIGNYAFYGCSSLTSVVIPEGVMSIGNYAFYGCSSLTSIEIPEGVTAIQQGTFSSCTKLVSVYLPDSLKSINGPSSYYDEEYGAFYNCSSLTSVVIPEGVTSIGNYTFYNCSSLTSITVPDSATSIGSGAFSGCSALEEITLPFVGGSRKTASNTYQYPFGYIFGTNSYTGSVTVKQYYYGSSTSSTTYDTYYLPASLKSATITGGNILYGAFYNCRSLTSVEILDSVTSIGNYAFYYCSSLTSIEIPEGVTSIGEDAFFGCSNLMSVEIPDSVTSIGDAAFLGCSNLMSVEIPDSVTSIGDYAFSDCSNLMSVEIPDSVTSIGDYAFHGCSLTSVEFLGDAPTTLGSNAFPQRNFGGFIICYHSGTSGWTTPMWNGYYTGCIDVEDFSTLNEEMRNNQGILFTLNDGSMTAVVGSNTNTNNNAGYAGSNDGSVTIPATVSKDGKTYRVIGIGQYAFAGNTFLKNLEIGANVTSIDSTAFLNCSNLQAFTVAEGGDHYSAADGILYDAVGYYLYVYPAAKTGESYTVPDAVKTIGQYAFYGSNNLTELVVPDNVQTIGAGAFAGCNSLEKITLPFIGASLDSDEDFYYVFYYYKSYSEQHNVPQSLKTVVITGGTLNSSSFSGCSYLESITLPANDTNIPYNCFNNCSALKQLLFTDTIEASAELEEGQVILPARITAIGNYAFQNCDALTFVHFSEGLKSIGYGAFYGCNGLTRVQIPASVTSIGSEAFNGCTAVTEFVVDEDNQNYCSDQWGVLYNKNMSNLIVYPANRIWPYYNVADETTSISSYAFNGCANLVNLYIPNTVTTLNDYCITSCPGMTVCAYADSKAYYYAGVHNLNAWPMDNYTLQGIEIYAMPEQVVQQMGSEDFSGLYMTMSYGGRTLQLDDYTLTYDPDKSGVQTVTVTFNGYTASFEILLYNGEVEYLMDFGELDLAAGTMGLVAAYDTSDRLLKIESVGIVDGRALLVVPNGTVVKTAKLFILDKQTLSPVGAPILPKN